MLNIINYSCDGANKISINSSDNMGMNPLTLNAKLHVHSHYLVFCANKLSFEMFLAFGRPLDDEFNSRTFEFVDDLGRLDKEFHNFIFLNDFLDHSKAKEIILKLSRRDMYIGDNI